MRAYFNNPSTPTLSYIFKCGLNEKYIKLRCLLATLKTSVALNVQSLGVNTFHNDGTDLINLVCVIWAVLVEVESYCIRA